MNGIVCYIKSQRERLEPKPYLELIFKKHNGEYNIEMS
jgi:hypothetical protein